MDDLCKKLARRIHNQRVRLRQMESFKCRCCDLMAMRLQRMKRSNQYRAERDEAAAALAEAQAKIARLEAALRAIAANTCCEGCQEAARVARAALANGT